MLMEGADSKRMPKKPSTSTKQCQRKKEEFRWDGGERSEMITSDQRPAV